MADTILKLHGVKKKIGRKTIVTDLDFEVMQGEVFGFLGPNGAGKTTTIRMMTGLAAITAGDIFIGDYSIRHHFKTAIRSVGCIIENPDLYKYLSGLDNLRLYGAMYKVSEERIRALLDTVGLADVARNKVKTYSLGMKQRLGIAQALLHEPKLLILDEPTNGLDPSGIREFRELIRKLAAEQKMTIFVSSHILSEMQQLCDRVCIINQGRIVTIKTVAELIDMANNAQTAKLLLKTDNNDKAADILTRSNVAFTKNADGLTVETEKDGVPKIVAALTAEGVAIYGMDSLETQTLEDIFMKLTEVSN
ncbi:ABC transporter ATP-binding protein [Oscillospiraceae bacterium WX1]